jgi:hypothetical protein
VLVKRRVRPSLSCFVIATIFTAVSGPLGAPATAAAIGDAAVQTLDVHAPPAPFAAGAAVSLRFSASDAAGDAVAGATPQAIIVGSGPNVAAPASCNATDSTGGGRCSYTSSAASGGRDYVQVWIDQVGGSPGAPDAGEPQDTVPVDVIDPATSDTRRARYLNLTPESQGVPTGRSFEFVARVTAATGAPVSGVPIRFTEQGAGRFVNGSSELGVTTGSDGTATVTSISESGESGQQTVLASIDSASTDCDEVMGAGIDALAESPAGNCDDTSTLNFVGTAPSTTPSPSPGPSPAPASPIRSDAAPHDGLGISSPESGAIYDAGELVAADFYLDETLLLVTNTRAWLTSPSGESYAVESGELIDTERSGTWRMHISAVDPETGQTIAAQVTFTVLEPGAVGVRATAGAFVSTGDAVSEHEPLQASVLVPDGVDGGPASVVTLQKVAARDVPAGSAVPAGYDVLGELLRIEGPRAQDEPYTLVLDLHASLIGDTALADLTVFRNGVALVGCGDTRTACVTERFTTPTGVRLVVRTYDFSYWAVAAADDDVRVVDQQQTQQQPYTAYGLACPGANGNTPVAQTFVARRNGLLDSVVLRLAAVVAAPGTPDLVVQIRPARTGAVEPSVLAAATVTPADAPADPASNAYGTGRDTLVTFAEPATLVAGQKYALVLAIRASVAPCPAYAGRSVSVGTEYGRWFAGVGPGPDAYVSGEVVVGYDGETPDFYAPRNPDLWFQTYVTGDDPIRPVVTSLSPTAVTAGSPAFTLTVEGDAFTPEAQVLWNGFPLVVIQSSPTRLSVAVPAGLVATDGTGTITVVTNGGTTAPRPLFVTRADVQVSSVTTSTSETATGTATASAGATTSTATGVGTLTVAHYATNPTQEAFPPGTTAPAYFDVNTSPDSTFGSVTVQVCQLSGSTLYWYDTSGAGWTVVSSQAWDPLTRCITATLTATTSPSTTQLGGTAFATATTADTLSTLTTRYVQDPKLRDALQRQVQAAVAAAKRGDMQAKKGALNGYIKLLAAQSGKSVTTTNADILIATARTL